MYVRTYPLLRPPVQRAPHGRSQLSKAPCLPFRKPGAHTIHVSRASSGVPQLYADGNVPTPSSRGQGLPPSLLEVSLASKATRQLPLSPSSGVRDSLSSPHAIHQARRRPLEKKKGGNQVYNPREREQSDIDRGIECKTPTLQNRTHVSKTHTRLPSYPIPSHHHHP